MVIGSGNNNVLTPAAFEVGNYYRQFDVVYFSGYSNGGSSTSALQSQSGHYYYSGDAATSATSNLPISEDSPWTQDFFFESEYGSSVSFENKSYDIKFGDGYYSYLSKSENSLRAIFKSRSEKRTDKEAMCAVHLMEDSFNKGNKISGGYTGIYWTPFEPYDQRKEFYIEKISHNIEYPNTNSFEVDFYNENNSITDWRDSYIPFGNTRKFFKLGESYDLHDIVFASGTSYNIRTSGWYYYTGIESSTATSDNGPIGNSSMWTNNTFYFDINDGMSFNQSPRFYKQSFSNEYFIRVEDGINKKLLNLDFALRGRTDKEAKAISHFLINKRGRDQFYFTPPFPYNQRKVFFCPRWEHSIKYKNNNDTSVTFMEHPINYLSSQSSFLNLITIDPYLAR